MTRFRLRVMAQVLPFLLIAPVGAVFAQAPPSPAEAAAALNAATNPAPVEYTRAQIDQLVAPIALYPDQLLSQVLMAATYPQQIDDAAQWLQDSAHAALQGDALVAALEPLPWDPSVKALVAFPQIVVMLDGHLDWTQALGVAFATQQAEVMSRVQTLRQLAMHSGRLEKMRYLRTRKERDEIVIMPAEPDRIFVPVYNPTLVYGQWPDRDYPPVYIPPPPNFSGETIEPGIEFGAGYAVIGALSGWSRPDWHDHRITIDRTQFSRITRGAEPAPGDVWQHRGPVVLAMPRAAPRPEARANAPAGTIDPARAAAVVNLPRRAAAQPAQIETHAAVPPHPGAERGEPTQAVTRPDQSPGQRPPATLGALPHPQPAEPHPEPGGPEHAGVPPHPTPGPEHAGVPPHPTPGPEHAAVPPHPTPGPEHAAVPPHSTPGPEHAAVPPHPTPGPEHAGEPPHPAPVLEHAAVPPHPTPAPEHAAVPPHPAPAPEHAAVPPHPTPGPEHAAVPPHPTPAPEHAAVPPHPAPPPEHAAVPPHPEPVGQGSSAPPAAAPHPAPPATAAVHPPGGPHPAARPDEKEKKEP